MWEQLKIAKSILISKLIFNVQIQLFYLLVQHSNLDDIHKISNMMEIRLCLFVYLHLPQTSHFIGITKTNGPAVTKQGRDSKTVSKNTTNNNNNSTNNKSSVRKVSNVSVEAKQTKKQTTVTSKRPEEKINNNNSTNTNT